MLKTPVSMVIFYVAGLYFFYFTDIINTVSEIMGYGAAYGVTIGIKLGMEEMTKERA